jgi:predicted acylesterase/phospholipase RssA
MTIKHLVISGGGQIMLQMLGAIKCLEENKFINFDDIKRVYGTSAGAIVGTLICLKFDLDTINDYIINRPWQDVFKINVERILNSYSNKGVFDSKIIEKCFKPLFDAKDISMNITLEEFYTYSNIEIHFFTFEINEFQTEDISYLTHPTLSLITAIQMTCGLPILLTPVCIDNKCYIDGGIVCNYPLNYCINHHSNINTDEILSFKIEYTQTNNTVNSSSTMLEFVVNFLFKLIYSLNTDNSQPKIKHELLCCMDKMSVGALKSALFDMNVRNDLFKIGTEVATEFLSKIKL